jgi:carbon-monoxide dehydrogenase medium subunit
VADVVLHAPTSVQEASQMLAHYQGDARPIAGGTAVVLMLRQGLIRPQALVRLDRVAGMDRIALEDGHLRLGALATLRAVGAHPLVEQHLPVLAGACRLVGNVRVRNAATIGGNVCEADYASDPPGVLVALDARVRVQGGDGARELPVSELITDFYETSLAPDEVVADVLVPIPPPGTHAVYLKYVTRSSEDRPCVGVTGMLRVDDGRIEELRVGVGAVAGRPLRLPEVEAMGRGERASEDLFGTIGQAYADAVDPVADARGSADYRRQMVAVFVRRALRAALGGESGGRKT